MSKTPGNKEDELIPHFVPALADILAFKEKEKGFKLTEDEVFEITNNSACIMMRRSDLEKLPKPFKVIDPDDAWVDWHRVRPQSVGDVAASIILVIPCMRRDVNALCELAREAKYEVDENAEERTHNNIDTWFLQKSMYEPVLADADYNAISQHECVLTLYSGAFIADDGIEKSTECLKLIGKMIEGGALLVSCLSGFVTHSNLAWQRIASAAANPNRNERLLALCQAFMQPRIEEEYDYLSCGLQMLGIPDLIIKKDAVSGPEEEKRSTAQDLIWIFVVYLLTECNVRPFYNRNTFSVSAEAQKYRVIWEPCDYPDTSPMYNPFGRRRFTPV